MNCPVIMNCEIIKYFSEINIPILNNEKMKIERKTVNRLVTSPDYLHYICQRLST